MLTPNIIVAVLNAFVAGGIMTSIFVDARDGEEVGLMRYAYLAFTVAAVVYSLVTL